MYLIGSGWYHQVLNIGETLSINHNWINSHNLDDVLKYLNSVYIEIVDIIKEHSDMEDFEEHCQKILKANCGMNIDDFLNMIEVSSKSRIQRLSLKEQQDFESLETFLKVLDMASLSQIASNSASKIQILKEEISRNQLAVLI